MPADLPEYVEQPLRIFKDNWNESTRLLDVTKLAVENLIGVPGLMETLNYNNSDPKIRRRSAEQVEKERRSWEQAKETAAVAQKEVSTGFRSFHAQTLVGLWGALEVAVEDLVVAILLNEPEALERDTIKKTKVTLAEFHAMDGQHRMRRLVSDATRTSHGVKQGVDAFECVFETADLDGSVEDSVKRRIWEANHVRNVIVHRGSKADRELVKSCPWLKLEVGDEVIVSPGALWEYSTAFAEYTLIIRERLAKRYATKLEE